MNVMKTENLHVSIKQKPILHRIQFHVKQGEIIGLIGPNGSGKSTLLKAIATIHPITNGTICIFGQDLQSYRQRELAKLLSYVPQDTFIDFDFKAKEVVYMGRHAHRSRFETRMEEDFFAVKNAMMQTNTWHLAESSILRLSGGQRQLVLLAKALAQDTPLIILDEPISALDIYFQLQVLSLLKRLSEKGKTIMMVLHDLNLAARYCTKLLLLKKGKVTLFGTPEEVLQEDILQQTYGVLTKVRKDHVTNSMTVTPLLYRKGKERWG